MPEIDLEPSKHRGKLPTMFRLLIVAALGLSILGCATTTPAQRLANNQAACLSYGFKAGTDAFANCLLQQDIAADQADAARRAQIGAGLRAMAATPPRPSTMTCNTFSGPPSIYQITTTTCR